MGPTNFDILPESGFYKFLRPVEDSKALVICLHGYSASPYEVKDLGEHLYELGFSSICPLLPGHGIKDHEIARREFSALTTEKLFTYVVNLIEENRHKYKKIVLHGQSMGGMLTFYIAGQKLVDGVLITAAPLVIPWTMRVLAFFMGLTNLTIKMNKPPLEQGWSYDFMCTKPIRSLSQLIKLANQNLKRIDVPMLLCYSHGDSIAAATGDYLEENLPKNAEIRWFDDSGHVMLLDKSANQVIEAIGEFCVKYFD